MRNLNKLIIASLGFIFLLTGCVKPDIIERNDETGVANIWVEIPGLKERFNGYFNDIGDTAYIDMTYFYPAESDNEVDLSNLILRTNISVDAIISPALGMPMDLSQPLPLIITAGNGQTRQVIVVVRKLGDLSVKSISVTIDDNGNPQTVSGIQNGDEIIFFVLPGIDLSDAKLNVTVSRHSQTSIANGTSIDLNNPVSLTVTGIDGRTHTYTLRAMEPQKLDYGLGIYKMLFNLSNAQLAGFTTTDNNRAMAVSGDYFVLSISTTPSVYKVYNRFTGEYVKDLTPPPGGIRSFAIANDSKGRILVSSWAPKNAAFVIYVYENVDDDNPQLLVNWINNNPTGISGDGGVGRRLNIYGDLAGDAVITATAGQSNIFYRWRVENGSLVSSTPEAVPYNSIINNIWAFYVEAQPISTAANGDYFINYPSEIALVSGATNTRVAAFNNDASVVGLNHNATDYIEFNNAKYLLSGTFTSGTTRMVIDIFDISDQSKYSLTPASSEFTKFKVFRSPQEITAASNGNGAGDVVGVVSEDGEIMHVYLLLTNGGVMAYEFTIYSPQ